MCLFVRKEEIDRVIKRLSKRGEIRCWAIKRTTPLAMISEERGLWSIFEHSLPGTRIKNPGVIKSNRRKVPLSPIEKLAGTVDIGMHVFLKYDSAVEYKNTGKNNTEIVLPVTCKKEHFVAAGNGQAVFTQYTISARAFNKAIGGKS